MFISLYRLLPLASVALFSSFSFPLSLSSYLIRHTIISKSIWDIFMNWSIAIDHTFLKGEAWHYEFDLRPNNKIELDGRNARRVQKIYLPLHCRVVVKWHK
jgi:hypothetical protein